MNETESTTLEDILLRIRSAVGARKVDDVIRLCRRALEMMGASDLESSYRIRLSLAVALSESEPPNVEYVEEARRIYEELLEELPLGDWRRRSSIQRNLAGLFEARQVGNGRKNIQEAIDLYEAAASDALREHDATEWALVTSLAGFARMKILGTNRELATAAANCLERSLETLHDAEYSEEREEISEALKALRLRFHLSDRSGDSDCC